MERWIWDGSCSVSDIQDYIEYIIENYEMLTKVPPIHVYINRINNGSAFKIKDGYNYKITNARITNAWNNEIVWQHKKLNRQNKKMEKMYQVLKLMK